MHRVLLALLALVALGGCFVPKRTLTADAWDQLGNGHYYLSYTDAECAGSLCRNARPRVLLCRIEEDNQLSCVDQDAVTEALSDEP